jgi:oxygen-independent coproporphyrinogen-3 oxidase
MAGIYVHIPYCKQACHYCNFHFSASGKNREAMSEALIKELMLRRNELDSNTVQTIYLGGGSPSILPLTDLEALFNTLATNYTIDTHAEITLEVNPDDVTVENLRSWKGIGVNRLSLGIQSFFEEDLKWMNRAHNAQEARSALTQAKAYFDNITADLIYGIPGMELKRWQANLETLFGFEVPHISAYALTIEPRTAFGNRLKRGQLVEMDEADVLAHFELLVDLTGKHGLLHYETSNFGRPAYFSRHNRSYWEGKSYLGIGPSAHSFNGRERSWNIAHNSKYLKSLDQGELPITREILTLDDQYNEYVMTGLRTMWGLSLERIAKQFGVEKREYAESRAKPWLNTGMMEKIENTAGDNILLLNGNGKFLADGIASDLFIV